MSGLYAPTRAFICSRLLSSLPSSEAATSRIASPSFPSNFLWRRLSSSESNPKKPKKMEELKANPYFQKYSSKLLDMQKSQPEVFQQKIAENKAAKEAAASTESMTTEPTTIQQPTIPAKPVLKLNKERKLSDVMKLDLLEDRTAEDITNIWNDYHKTKDGYVSAAVPAAMYERILSRASEFPIFVYPLPRKDGYEFFVAECRGNECYFTQLLSYQTHKEDSPPCLSVIHFEDLKPKGIILMRGEYDKNVLNPLEVQCLLNQMQLYYGTDDHRKQELVKAFNREPEKFQYMDLISEVEQSFTFATKK